MVNKNNVEYVYNEFMEKRRDINPETGLHKYGDTQFADNVNKKYPIDTEEHIRASWNYIHMPRNFEKYSENDCETIKKKIIKAWKENISPDGPPAKD